MPILRVDTNFMNPCDFKLECVCRRKSTAVCEGGEQLSVLYVVINASFAAIINFAAMPNFLCVLRTDNEVMCPLATLGDSSSSLARTYPTIFPRSSATCKSVGHETAVY